MTDDSALLAAVRAAPADDAPRLIYADWLDEHEQPERAQFIRRQIENARRDDGRSVSKHVVAGRGFRVVVGVEPWRVFRPTHVSPMLAFVTWGGYGRCVAWHRGFPAVVSCTARHWHLYHQRFPGPIDLLCLTNANSGEWAKERPGVPSVPAGAADPYLVAFPQVRQCLYRPLMSDMLMTLLSNSMRSLVASDWPIRRGAYWSDLV